jgi:hypothetical protein
VREQPILKRVMLACGRGMTRLWRNNCGSLPDPKTGVWIKFGVGNPGGSDLLGFHTVRITERHLGMKLAVFTALEVKAKSGRIRKEQQWFIDMVKAAGGIAGVVRSVDEANSLLTQLDDT